MKGRLVFESLIDGFHDRAVMKCVEGRLQIGDLIGCENRRTDNMIPNNLFEVTAIELYQGVFSDELETSHGGCVYLDQDIQRGIKIGTLFVVETQ